MPEEPEQHSPDQADNQTSFRKIDLDLEIETQVQETALTKLTNRVTTFFSRLQAKIKAFSNNPSKTWQEAKSTIEKKLQMIFRKRARSRRKSKRDSEAKRLRNMKLLRLGAVVSLIGAVLMIVGFFAAFAWYSRELPKPGEVVRRQGFSTKIYDREGRLLYDLYDQERRTPIEIEQIPEHLKQATIAIEDKEFYQHEGFDILTVFRVPYNFIFRGRVVGGSTLTQQLVKNALLTNERSVERKFKELVLSLQIERTFTKDEILEMYLNEAPYGGTAWGVGTASELYFDKPVTELSLVESAILAGLPQRPTAYSPYTGRTNDDGTPLWQVRTRGVLRRMHEDGYLTDLAYEDALSKLDEVEFERSEIQINAPHFVFYVRDKLAEMYGEEVVETGGFRVTTTLDLELHEEAQNIVAEEVGDVEESHHITNGAALVMDPRNGEVISMVGSRDYNNSDIGGQFNVVVDALRQPGSSIKPITYLGLLQRGVTPASILVDVPTTFQANENSDPYNPQNYDGQFRGPVSVRNSLGNSLNIPAVKALARVGVENFLQLAYSMGLESLEPTEENLRRFGLALTLGGGEVRMLDLITAYSSFANQGKKIEPVAILKVEDQEGSTLYEHRHVEGQQIIQPEEAFLISDILSDNNARLMTFGANSLLNTGQPIAVKTGTTDELRDNWAVGWSREVIVGSWVGNNDNTAMRSVASGISGATPIWRRVMLAALDHGYNAPEWPVPDGIEQVEVDQISGYPPHHGFPRKTEYVIENTLPSLPDPVHAMLKVCNEDGQYKLATEADILQGAFEEREYIVLKEDDPVSQDGTNRWQIGINGWIADHPDEKYHFPTEYCGEVGEVFVTIFEPEDETTYEEEEIDVHMEANSAAGIERMDLFVDGELRETIKDRKYEGTINLPAGQYTLRARAYSRDGDEAESDERRIGTGGIEWDAEEEEEYACNSECDTDEQCQTANENYICHEDRCRLESNRSSNSCEPAEDDGELDLPDVTDEPASTESSGLVFGQLLTLLQ